MKEQEQWKWEDVIPGGLILGLGSLITLYAFLAMGNGVPFIFWAPGWLVGPLFVILGGNAIYRGMRSRGRNRDST